VTQFYIVFKLQNDTVRNGHLRSGTVWDGWARLCRVIKQLDTFRYGLVRSCTVWYGFDTLRYAAATLKKACGYSINITKITLFFNFFHLLVIETIKYLCLEIEKISFSLVFWK
jgi:hypothetical protein